MPKPTVKKLDNKERMKGTFTTVIDLDTLRAASKDDKLPTRIPILPKGEYMTLPYGNMVLDNNVFEQMIGNFNGNVRRAVPLDVDHAWENTRAAGWIKKLSNEDDGLWGEVDYTPFGAGLVENKEYKMISAEWSFDYVDPQKSTHHGAVLVAATLTNRPLMQSMPTITASDKNLTNANGIVILLNENTKADNKPMPTLTDILAKPVADRTEEDLKFLQENEAELSDEQKEQLEQETKDAADEAKAQADLDAANAKLKEEEDAKKKEEAEAAGKTVEELEKEAADAEAAKEAANKDQTIKAGELARLQKIEADFKAAESLKAAEAFVKPFIASSEGGKVLPAGKEALIKLSQTLNDSQRELLTSVLKATLDQTITKVAGQDNKEGLTATEQYNNLIKESMKAGKSPAEANKEVRKAHADIYKAYLAENN